MAGNKSRFPVWILAVLVLAVLAYILSRRPGINRYPTPTQTAVPQDFLTNTPAPPVATPTPTCVPLLASAPWVQRVLVGPNACVVVPECVIIKAGRDTVQWNTSGVSGSTALWIDFGEEIFSGMSQNGSSKTYRVHCVGSQCTSGAVKPVVPPPPPGTQKEYKYSQTLHSSTNDACDARVIIQW